MDNATYKRNVMKTLSIKPAKLGLKQVTRKTPRMNVFHAAVGMSTEAMELLKGLAPYVSGASRLTEPMKVNAFEECGDLGYYLMVAAKFLKVKVPGSGKKVKLHGVTRTEAILQIVTLTGDILDLAKKYMYGPVMDATQGVRHKKVYDLTEGGSKIKIGGTDEKPEYKHKIVDEPIEVLAVNTSKTEALWIEREQKMAELLDKLIPLYWAFVYDTFGVPPANVFVGNIAKLEKRYGKGYFELSEAEDRDVDEELGAMANAAEAHKAAATA